MQSALASNAQVPPPAIRRVGGRGVFDVFFLPGQVGCPAPKSRTHFSDTT